jgi:hypothetical protein
MKFRVNRQVLTACAAVSVTLAVAPAANAASFIKPDGTVLLDGTINPITSTPNGAPFQFRVNYDGFGGDPANVVPGLGAIIDFTFNGVSNGGLWYEFGFVAKNTSDVDSRVTVFGFNVDPNAAAVASTGLFDVAVNALATKSKAKVPNFGLTEVCFKEDGQTNNCNSGKEGIDDGTGIDGTLTLKFNSAPSRITLSNFMVRYQGINGIQALDNGIDGSAIGRGIVTPVPEPATWGLMIAGFAAAGFAMRRRAPLRLARQG